MKRILSPTVVILAASLLSCSGREADFPQVEGWTLAGDVLTYDADNLWEYINGAAELFLEYDVQTCRTAGLASGDLLVTVDLYDMGAPLNAFGIFNREHPAAGSPLAGATEAAISPPYQALMFKGGTYVKVNAVEGELTAATGRGLLEALASVLPGQTDLPSELESLPQNGILPGSEGYVREGFLGLTELSHCLYADYADVDGQSWEGFVVLPPAGSSPAAVWESLADVWASLEHEGRTVLYKEVPYRGLAGIVQTDQSIVGVAGASDQAQLLSRLEGLIR